MVDIKTILPIKQITRWFKKGYQEVLHGHIEEVLPKKKERHTKLQSQGGFID